MEILDAQARLLGRDLPLVSRGRGLRQLRAQPVQGAAGIRDLLGDLGAPLAQAVTLGGGLGQGSLGGLKGDAGSCLHVRGRGQLRLSCGLAPGVAGALLALGGGSLAQGAGAGGGAPRLFFEGTQAQARLVFSLAGLARSAGGSIRAGLRVFKGFGRADGVGAVESGAGGNVLLTGPRDLLVGAARHVVGALGLGAGCLRGRLGAGQLLGFLGALRVFLTQGLQSVVCLADAAVQVGVCLAELLGHLGHAGLGGLGLRARLLVVCTHGEHGGGLAATLHRPGAQHVAARRDDGAHAGHVQHGRGGLKRAGDDPVQQGREGCGGPLAGDDVGKPRRALGQLGADSTAGPTCRIVGRSGRIRCHDQPQRAPGRAGSVKLAQASSQGVDDDRVGEGSQRGGDGVFETGCDVQEGCDLAEYPGASQQLGGAVLGGEQLLERVAAGLPARAVGAGLALNAEQLVHAGARGVAAGRGLGVRAGRSPAGFFLG